MAATQHMRWESDTRWYEVFVSRDLFDQCVVLRAWGGKYSRKHGQKCHAVRDEAAASQVIARIHRRRISGEAPYVRKYQ